MIALPRYDLQPGRLCLARKPIVLQTILGSCVSVTLWSARLNAGAMCHGRLPRCPTKWPAGSTVLDGHRYVDFSIRYLAEQFDALGVNRSEVQVRVFGGADVLPISCTVPGKLSIGALNCESALEVLRAEGLTVLASDLGGVDGRRLRFNTGTGEVLMHRIVISKDVLPVRGSK